MILQPSDNTLTLRPINDLDRELLLDIYSSTRKEELDHMTHWSEAEKQAFLNFQFTAQHTYYIENYRGANFWILEKNALPIGRLYLDIWFNTKTMRIIDITLLPAWRGQGIGRQLLLDIMAFAEKINRGVSIHVESFNPAMRLYKRLGFELVSTTNDVYHLFEWNIKTTVPESI